MAKRFKVSDLVPGEFWLMGVSSTDLLGRYRVVYEEEGCEPYILGQIVRHRPRGDYSEPANWAEVSCGQPWSMQVSPTDMFWSIAGQEYEEDGTPAEYSRLEDACHNLWLRHAKVPRYVREGEVVLLPTATQRFQILKGD